MKQILIAFFFLAAITSCESNNAQTSNTTSLISPKEFQELLESQQNIQLIDVRTKEEFAEGHLSNAINIDYNGSDFATKIQLLDKQKTTLVYCLSGGRSNGAMKWMAEHGFQKVVNLKGGTLAWKANGLPLQGEKNTAWQGMTQAEYQQIIAGDIPVLVDFKAKWCGPCKQLTPILNELQAAYAGKLKVVPIDIDEHKSLAKFMSVTSIPLLVYHKNGKVIMNQEGLIDKQSLISLLKLNE
jgi:thioredoxin